MTKFEKYATLFIVVCLMILVTVVCCKISYRNGYRAGWQDCVAGIQVDTTQHTDTSSYVNPEPVEVKPAPPSDNGRERLLLGTIAELRARLDSLSAAKPDTAFVEIPVPVEVKTYADSTYRAQVSGYRPSLDWIEVYQKTTTITQYIDHPAPRWSFGVTAGLGVVWSGELRIGPGVVAGVSYRF